MAKKVESTSVGAVMARWGLPGAGVLLLGLLIWWLTRPSAVALLEVDSPSPDQIRRIATILLVHDDFMVRSKASEKLSSLGQAAVPVLKEIAQTHSDPRVCKAVLDILSALDAKGAADAIVQRSRDSNAEIRREAVIAAGRLEDPRSREVLQQGLQSSEPGIRLKAVEGIGARRDASSVAALQGALKDPDPTVHLHAARALQLITGQDYRNHIRPGR